MPEELPSSGQTYDELGAALLHAARDGQVELVRDLLRRGANIEYMSGDGATALSWAAIGGQAHVVREFLLRGAVVDHASNDGDTALLNAAYRGCIEAVRVLLDHGAAIDHRNSLKQSALFLAAGYPIDRHEYGHPGERHNGHDAVVRELLARGADVEYRDLDNQSAIEAAAANGNVDAVLALFDKGAALGLNSDEFEGDLLRWAATQGYLETVAGLLDRGALIDNPDSDGWTALTWAISYRRHAVAKALLDRGAIVGEAARDMFDERLQSFEQLAESAYDGMYDARDKATAAACYANAKDYLHDAIALSRRLNQDERATRLEARLHHIKAVFRSQLS